MGKSRDTVMKINTQLIILAICAFSICFMSRFVFAKTRINGVQTNEKVGSREGPFLKIKTCTPELKWEPSNSSSVTYDVTLNIALIPPHGALPPEVGDKLFYSENITQTSVTVNPPLPPNRKFFWSVRQRYPDGSVSPWTTYDKSFISWWGAGDMRNFWFGIMTPKECL